MRNKKVVVLVMLVLVMMTGGDIVLGVENRNYEETNMETDEKDSVRNGPKRMVIVDGARLRTAPNLKATVLGMMYKGEKVTLLKTNTDRTWLYIERRDGTKGWVLSEYVH